MKANVVEVVLALVLVCIVTLVILAGRASAAARTAEWNRQIAICGEQLKIATASDSLRIYRLQPKCLP